MVQNVVISPTYFKMFFWVHTVLNCVYCFNWKSWGDKNKNEQDHLMKLSDMSLAMSKEKFRTAVKCERAIGRSASNALMAELCRECTSRHVKGLAHPNYNKTHFLSYPRWYQAVSSLKIIPFVLIQLRWMELSFIWTYFRKSKAM